MKPNHHQFKGIVDALSSVLAFEHPADAVMSGFFRQNRKLGAGDRHVISDAVYVTLRRYHYLCALIAPDDVTPRHLVITSLLRVLDCEVVDLARYLSEGEIAFAEKVMSRDPELDLVAKSELPQWVVDSLGWPDDEVIALGQSLQQKAPLDLRVNSFKERRKKVLAQFSEEGISAIETPYSRLGIRLQEKAQLQNHSLYTSGVVEVQDEGSQLLGLLLGAKRGQTVVDFCAGAGGKTLALASAMANIGRLYAFDVSEKRLKNLAPRLKRSGLSNVYSIAIGSENDERVKRLNGKVDRVLVDAPCSGLGTLRRNPDLKFRQSLQTVKAFNEKQAAILEAASQLLKPGGRLVYATCSLLADENENIVDAFLGEHPEFSLLPAKEALPKSVKIEMGDYLKLYPHRHNTDGFFAAVLVRG
ncbi:RsmB/NOP family class I SAM-dependent RNA methyltransferase [Pseudomonadota bacterium]